MLAHVILISDYIIWYNVHSYGLEVTKTVLHDCPASLRNILSASLLASKHEIVPRVNNTKLQYSIKPIVSAIDST